MVLAEQIPIYIQALGIHVCIYVSSVKDGLFHLCSCCSVLFDVLHFFYNGFQHQSQNSLETYKLFAIAHESIVEQLCLVLCVIFIDASVMCFGKFRS